VPFVDDEEEKAPLMDEKDQAQIAPCLLCEQVELPTVYGKNVVPGWKLQKTVRANK
jgi:hypothetical protein